MSALQQLNGQLLARLGEDGRSLYLWLACRCTLRHTYKGIRQRKVLRKKRHTVSNFDQFMVSGTLTWTAGAL